MPRELSKITGVKADVRTFSNEPSLACDKTLVGIELEIENSRKFNERASKLRLWSEVGERSLRNHGAEYVTPPIMGKDIVLAIDELRKHIDGLSIKPVVTERTGLHVHLDFRDATVQSLFRFVVVYTIFERFLFSQCEAGREDNAYCTPLSECDDLLTSMHRLTSTSERTALRFLQDYPKYTAINLRPLTSLGTIEIRMHEGTVDPDKILRWVNLLLSIKRYSDESTASPQNLVDFVCASPDEYFAAVFGNFAPVDYSESVYAGMLDGARAAQYMYRAKPVQLGSNEESLFVSLYGEQQAEKAPSKKTREGILRGARETLTWATSAQAPAPDVFE